MNKYKVKISHLFSEILSIEALDEKDAKEKARLELQNENRAATPQYEATIPVEHWPVITEDKYNEILEKVNQEKSNIITPNIITP